MTIYVSTIMCETALIRTITPMYVSSADLVLTHYAIS